MNDDFSEGELVQITNEELNKESRLRVDTFSYCDLIQIILFFIATILTVSLISIFAFYHYGISEEIFYFEQSNQSYISLSKLNIIPYTGFFKIYFQINERNKKKMQRKIDLDMTIMREFNFYNSPMIKKVKIKPIIKFDGNSRTSFNSVTLYSTHDTRNSTIKIYGTSTVDANFDGMNIAWEMGSKSTVIFSFVLKILSLIISTIIFILFVWTKFDGFLNLKVRNFEVSFILFLSFIFYALFTVSQRRTFFYFVFSFLSTAILKILTKLIIIFHISSIRLDRSSDNRNYEEIFAKFGYFFYSIFELISVFLMSFSIFTYDQIGSELFGMKIEFFLNISFIAFIIFEFKQTVKLIDDQEKLKLKTFFSLSLIYIFENVVVQYFIAIKNIYFCQQAADNINYASSFVFIVLILSLNWPIEDNIEIYYQQDVDQSDLMD